MPRCLVSVLNQTAADQNFILTADPGMVETTPNIALPLALVWRAAAVPALFGILPSQATFAWDETFALALGRMTELHGFTAGTSLPMSEAGGNQAVLGFIGTPTNGALKIDSLTHRVGGGLGFTTDATLPIAAAQQAAGVTYAAAPAIGGLPCLALEALPNLSVTIKPEPRYGIVAAGLNFAPGDLLPSLLLGSVFPLTFGPSGILRLVLGPDNLFRTA